MNNKVVYGHLKNLAVWYAEKGEDTNASYVMKLARYVGALREMDFTKVTKNNNGHMNLGDIVEKIVLEYLGLESEDNEHEVKAIVVNTPNILKNKSVNTAYIFYMKQKYEGLYRVNAQDILGVRLTKDNFLKLKREKVATLEEVKKALKA